MNFRQILREKLAFYKSFSSAMNRDAEKRYTILKAELLQVDVLIVCNCKFAC